MSLGVKSASCWFPIGAEVIKCQSGTKADTEFTRAFASIPKIVISRSLERALKTNTRESFRTNLRVEILKLKQEQGKNNLVDGVSVPSPLIELGLVDEYRFVVGPIVAGEEDVCWKASA